MVPEIPRKFIWSRDHSLPFRPRWFRWLAVPGWIKPTQGTCPHELIKKLYSNGQALMSWDTDFAVDGTVTFTFHVELNDPNAKGPLHLAE